MSLPHLRLGVNIDHVATVRNARGGAHPDPVRAAWRLRQQALTVLPPISARTGGISVTLTCTPSNRPSPCR